MKKNKTGSNFKQFKALSHETTELTMERYPIVPFGLNEEMGLDSIEEHEVKNPFWNSLKERLGKSEESLPEMIEELSPKEANSTYVALMGTYIQPTMAIKGNLESESPISIRGTVYGNVKCSEGVDARHTFRIHGDVSAESFYSFGGQVTGDIHCTAKIEIGEDSVIFGDLSAQQIVVNGQVEGNLIAVRSIYLSSTARVNGNLSGSSFTVEPGAQLKGMCEIKAEK